MSAGTVTETSTVQQTIITTLDSATSAGRRIYYGSRLQTSLLPAITFEVTSVESVSVGGAPLSAFSITFNAVAESASAALTLAESLYGVLALELSWVLVESGRAVLQETQPENGEEAGLYIATVGFTFYA